MGLRWITGLAFALIVTTANASIISVNDWSYINGVGDTGTTLFRVTETFTSAAELGGAENLYEYQVENLSDYSARLFRVANPDDLSRTMNGPTGWNERTGVQNFIWETSDSSDNLLPGGTLGGFQIYTSGLIPELTFADFGITGVGWIEASDVTGSRIDILGEITRPVNVPEPASLLLLAVGLLGIAVAKRSNSKTV